METVENCKVIMPSKEIWKLIPKSIDKYYISSHGRLSCENVIIEPTSVTSSGLLMIKMQMTNNTCPMNQFIHRLTAIAFVPNPMKKMFVVHINEDNSDNHIENLQWVSQVVSRNHSKEILEKSVSFDTNFPIVERKRIPSPINFVHRNKVSGYFWRFLERE
jgi:hypothetical protein